MLFVNSIQQTTPVLPLASFGDGAPVGRIPCQASLSLPSGVCSSNSARSTCTSRGASMPTRTLSPRTSTIVIADVIADLDDLTFASTQNQHCQSSLTLLK
jgi:hypothetical protein